MKLDLIEVIKKIKVQYKITFLSTIVFGVLSQGMGFFNKFSFHDDIGGGFSTLGATITPGRWMLEILSKLELLVFGDGHFSLPLFNGIISIIYIGIVACLFVSLFEINNKVLCLSVGGILVVFPTITGMFAFMFTVPSYMFSLLIGVYGAYLICKNNNWLKIIIGIILMSCSIGIYQAFIPVLLCTFVIYLIKYCSEHCDDTKEILKKALIILISFIGSMVLYFVINKIALSIIDAQLTTYQGINNMGQDSILDYLYRILYAYGRFFILSDESKYNVYYSNTRYVYYLIMIIVVILMLLLFIKILKTNKLSSFILLTLFGLMPLASNFIFVMVAPENVHALMVYGQVMLFILAIMLFDNDLVEKSIISYLSIVGITLLLLICVMFTRFDNQCYLKAEFNQEEAISYFTTLITRIKSTENYDDELPISFIFIDGSHIVDKSLYTLENLDYIKLYPYDAGLYEYVNNYEWKTFMKRWCGYAPEIVDGTDLENNEEVLSMSCYPDDGSIKVVNNRVVVRFR